MSRSIFGVVAACDSQVEARQPFLGPTIENRERELERRIGAAFDKVARRHGFK